MNRKDIAALLHGELVASGRTDWELARRANVRLELVRSLLAGSGATPVEALVRVAEALDMEVAVRPGQPSGRAIGPISSMVDEALTRLQRRALAQPPAAPATAAEFLMHQRALLDRLEAFVRSGAYLKLLSQVQDISRCEPPEWMPEWLVHHASSLGATPLDLLRTDEDMTRVAEHLAKVVLDVNA
ncbi:MAG: hypothetical protein RL385_3796 [Pseudomonadota bacterium]|jgi:hypothetical protein